MTQKEVDQPHRALSSKLKNGLRRHAVAIPAHTREPSRFSAADLDLMSRTSICSPLWALALVMLGGCASVSHKEARSRYDLVIRNVSVIADPDSDATPSSTIFIRDGKIVEVAVDREDRAFDAPEVVDGKGATALAGFWNSHVHLLTPVFLNAGSSELAVLETELERAFTQWGFTTVFDLASTMEIATAVRNPVEEGLIRGPRVLTVGAPMYPHEATPIYARPFYEAHSIASAEVESVGGAVSRIRAQAAAGADGVKLFTGAILSETEVAPMPIDIVKAATSEAARQDLPVFAHATNAEGLKLAVEGGVDVLAHAVPLDGPWSEERARYIASKGVAMIPTLSLFELHPHPSTPVEVAVQQTRKLHAEGGRILFGTDSGFTDEFDTRAEIRLLAKAIGWRGVLASLTTAPAEILEESAQRGRLERGYIADIVLVCGNPASEIESLSRVMMVFRSGKIAYPLLGQRKTGPCDPPERATP